MEIETIIIQRRASYQMSEGDMFPFSGSISTKSETGAVKLILKEEHISPILAVIADGIIAATKSVAQDITAEVIQGLPPLITADAEKQIEDAQDFEAELQSQRDSVLVNLTQIHLVKDI